MNATIDTAKLEPGWYVINREPGLSPISMENDGSGWLWFHDTRGSSHWLPTRWTLGPRIEDLLRDAAKLCELRKIADGPLDPITAILHAGLELADLKIDAEIARGRP